jgi:hypothetical protein
MQPLLSMKTFQKSTSLYLTRLMMFQMARSVLISTLPIAGMTQKCAAPVVVNGFANL